MVHRTPVVRLKIDDRSSVTPFPLLDGAEKSLERVPLEGHTSETTLELAIDANPQIAARIVRGRRRFGSASAALGLVALRKRSIEL